MFELTNQQRKCFALAPVGSHWTRIEAKPGPYDRFRTFLYLDGDTVVKCIISGENQYCEYELSEKLSADGKYLLPKTARGKPVLLSSPTVLRRTGIGMCLSYRERHISLYSQTSECAYFSNSYLDDGVCDLDGFAQWVTQWCSETTDDDLDDILRFSQQRRRHVRYKEGDVFRFRIGRRMYGYGRIILDYDRMRKAHEPFWDILMSKPLVCSVYHIITDRDDVSVGELRELRSLPSTIITDNALFYGEFEIIGNVPVTEHEDYPVMYGRSIDMRENAVCYQCGRTFAKLEDACELYPGMRNNGVSFCLNFRADILSQCIAGQSNEPYWTLSPPHRVNCDLRNPKFRDMLENVRQQFGLVGTATEESIL